jgi:hypothetical protein
LTIAKVSSASQATYVLFAAWNMVAARALNAKAQQSARAMVLNLGIFMVLWCVSSFNLRSLGEEHHSALLSHWRP